jgi:hypothetical protein
MPTISNAQNINKPKYINEVNWNINKHKFFVGDHITFSCTPTKGIDIRNLLFKLIAKYNKEPAKPVTSWQPWPLPEFIFKKPGGYNLTAYIRPKNSNKPIQKYWIGSFKIDESPDYVLNHIPLQGETLPIEQLKMQSDTLSHITLPTIKNVDITLLDNHPIKFTPQFDFLQNIPEYIYTNKNKIIIAAIDSLATTDNFHPYQWAITVLYNCARAIDTGGYKSFIKTSDQLLKIANKHSVTENNAYYLLYSFPRKIYDRNLPPNWVSAIGQAYVLSAYINLYKLRKDQFLLKRIHQIANSFFDIRTKNSYQNGKWIANIEHGFLWYEEAPAPNDPQFHILNGHIQAIMGLYTYYLFSHDKRAIKYIQAAITTTKYYLMLYRKPGHTLNYFLYKNQYDPDYGPGRTIALIQWLYKITGDSFFKNMASTFLADSDNVGNYLAVCHGLRR